MSHISGFIAPDFFRGMKESSVENCVQKFVERFRDEAETDVINKFALSLFLDAEGRQDCHQNNFDMKVISHLQPEDQIDIFSIAHDIALRNNQTRKVDFCKEMIKKIEERDGIESRGDSASRLENVVPQRTSMFSTIGKVVIGVAVVAGLYQFGRGVVSGFYQNGMTYLNVDQFGYLQNCIPPGGSVSKNSCEWQYNQQPMSSEVQACMRLEESQQGNYAIMFDQQLLDNDFSQSLETAKKIRCSVRDSFLMQVVNKTNETKISHEAVNLMSHSERNRARGIVVDKRLEQKNCEGALQSAQYLSMSNRWEYLKKIVTSCQDESIQDRAIKLMPHHLDRQEALKVLIDQRISQNRCDGALRLVQKLETNPRPTKHARNYPQDRYLENIANRCNDAGIQEKAIDLMSRRVRDLARETVIDQRLLKGHCEGALKLAQDLDYTDQDKYLNRIIANCNDPIIQQTATKLLRYQPIG